MHSICSASSVDFAIIAAGVTGDCVVPWVMFEIPALSSLASIIPPLFRVVKRRPKMFLDSPLYLDRYSAPRYHAQFNYICSLLPRRAPLGSVI